VEDADLAAFFAHQRDPEAARMASVSPRDGDAFFAHWARILADETVVARTIVADGEVAGNVVVWTQDGRRLVGYWIGRPHWGRGIATEAVRRLVAEVTERPLYAFVATENVGSLRVLEKCGFAVPPGDVPPVRGDDDVEEVLLRLDR
jgi:RimJ/RimL family protein N-acetyltransferase